MTDSRTGRKADRVCVLVIFTILLVAFPAIVFDFYYDLNDDTLIKDVVSGVYTGTPSGYCVQMLYPLAWLIALLYKVVPNVAWYGLFLCVCQFGAVVMIAVRLTAIFKTTRGRIMALLAEFFLFFGLFLRELVIVQYSVTAGVCMMCAIFLFITSDSRPKKGRNIIPLLLVVLAFMIRTEICLMLMPFVLYAGVFQWASEEKIFTVANVWKYLMLIGGVLLGMLAVFSLDILAYHGNEWSNFRDFFDARTKLYDFYDIPDYEQNIDFYESVGLSRESYTLLENYNFALDDSIDTWLLESIAEYQKGRLNNTFGFVSKNSVREALWLYKDKLLHNASAADFAVVAAYLIYLLLCLVPAAKNGQFWKAFGRIAPKIALLLLIRSVLWLYLYMVDRLLDRVTMPLIMAELACIIGFGMNDIRRFAATGEEEKPKVTALTVYLIVIFMLTVMFAKNFLRVNSEYEARERADERWYALMHYCRENEEQYYVIDVYSSTSYEGASYSEKIFCDVDHSYKNFDYCGGWLAKSPIARQKLADRGFRDLQSALLKQSLTQKKVYFVAAPNRDVEWLETYYGRRNINIVCECIDEIHTDSGETAFFVYGLKKK